MFLLQVLQNARIANKNHMYNTKLFLKKLFLFYMYKCLGYMHVGIPCMCVVPEEATRVHQMVQVTDGCWRLNQDPLQKQQVLLTTEASL